MLQRGLQLDITKELLFERTELRGGSAVFQLYFSLRQRQIVFGRV